MTGLWGFHLVSSYFCAAWPGRASLGPPPSLGFLVAGFYLGSPLSGFHTRWGLAQAIVIGEDSEHKRRFLLDDRTAKRDLEIPLRGYPPISVQTLSLAVSE